MNLVIIDNVNKKYHPYIHATFEVEMFICNNIILINKKNNTFLTVQTDFDTKQLSNQGYVTDQGMFERLIWNYNDNLNVGEKRLDIWI